MIKTYVFVVMAMLAGTAAAQPAGSAAAGSGSAAVAAGSGSAAVPAAGSGSVAVSAAGSGSAAVPAAGAATPARSPAELRQICAAAMNADPTFAKSIAATVDRQIDQQTIQAHEDANRHIQKNERHVIYAYAALWVIAAGFLVFLWLRQQALNAEIVQLRKELEAAGKEGA